MKSPSIDIIIPCYNVEHSIAKCINSILRQAEIENTLTLYLINDGSTDKTVSILHEFDVYENIYLLHQPYNKGLAAARNLGIESGKGELLIFLDSDMVVEEGWLSTHLTAIAKPGVVGVLGKSEPFRDDRSKLNKYLYHKKRGAGKYGENTAIPCQYFLFNNTSIKRSVLENTGVFDERITKYGGEDTDLAIRIFEHFPQGLRYSAKALCYHHHPRTFQEFCHSMYLYGKNNLHFLLLKHPDHSKVLAGDYLQSFKGKLIFNVCIRSICLIINKVIDNYFVMRYLVVESVIRGERDGEKGV
ncbi:MAG: glycosyltransferase [Candidatus Marinimicrobia bacterium]|jgi:glycosyltransferase involved in cell wall biosynthesis|nr:glycosyltransferase [Candidatus Neomarinimicrobiota bacterium]